jgi:hypothetical protein
MEAIRRTDINYRRQITGSGFIGGQYHTFLMTPIPEATDFLFLGSSLAGLSVVRRKFRRK